MKIQSLQYEDLSTGWKLDLIEFNPQLTLLVGASGVGKTQILEALGNLKKIAAGISSSSSGVQWDIHFVSSSGKNCQWKGQFDKTWEGISGFYTQTQSHKPVNLNYEKLIINNSEIIDRTREKILFKGSPTVKLSQCESVVSLLREEDEIKEIQQNIIKIRYNHTVNLENIFMLDLNENEYKSLEYLINSNKSLNIKLYFLYTKHKKEFDKIKSSFIEIFPSIEDVKINLIEFYNDKSIFQTDINIKEKNVLNWVSGFQMSSGMLKTFWHLVDLYLCPDNSVILIDEFENSLGINCIDEVTYQILASERNLQFIITSHHPYIINKIPYQDWKLVTRKGSVVQAKNATEYGIGKSRLQAFTQLGNLPEFSAGIES